ncbi:trypsin [Nilaparvata lugens]|uniref:trypsin n=1 Tax=Nilaparvata lugens TaxID=108931 RepID=UPI00193DAB50|nr:trypsin [Nilaparvata lugens]
MAVSFAILLLQIICVMYVGGEKLGSQMEDDLKTAPLQVLVVHKQGLDSNSSKCTGALVRNDVIITSALCISQLSKNPNELLVLNGLVPNQTYSYNTTITEIIPHPIASNAYSADNNIALVHLNKTFSSKPISLPVNTPEENTKCTAYSYREKSPVEIDVDVSCVHQCQRAYNASTPRYDVNIKTMLCVNDTKKRNVICEEDVGASLVCGNHLSGLAIYTQECKNSSMTSVYVSITPYVKWIDSTIKNSWPTNSSTSKNSSTANSMSSLSVIIGTIISFSISKLLAK